MIVKSLMEMTKGRVREFFREPSACIFVLTMPLLWMLILGFCVNEPQERALHIGVIQNEIKATTNLLKALSDPRFVVKEASYQDHLAAYAKGDLDVLIKDSNDAKGFELFYDANRAQAVDAAKYLRLVITSSLSSGQIIFASHQVTSQKARYIDFLVPGLLGLSLFTTSIYGTGMTIVVNRRENLLKRYRVTPMRPWVYILSHILGRLLLMALEFVCILGAGKLLFGFSSVGSLWDVYFFSLLASASFAALAILCGARLANAATYNGAVNLLCVPMMLVSGVWFSKAHLPLWLASLTDFLPLSAATTGLRKIAVEGVAFFSLGSEILVLGCYLVVAMALSAKIFRWS